MMLKRVCLGLSFSLLTASTVLAQTSGTIDGTVRDATGAPIPAATITVTNTAQGTNQTAVSNQDGEYVVPFLPPGNYQVRPRSSGWMLLTRSTIPPWESRTRRSMRHHRRLALPPSPPLPPMLTTATFRGR